MPRLDGSINSDWAQARGWAKACVGINGAVKVELGSSQTASRSSLRLYTGDDTEFAVICTHNETDRGACYTRLGYLER